MATAIQLNDLHYPDHEMRSQIMLGDWPAMSPHQWAILVGQPMPFMPWDAVMITREEYEASKSKQISA